MSYFLGIDAGGSGGRCLLVEPNSMQCWVARRPWSHSPAPGTQGLGVELDLALVWRKLGEACREVLERAGATPGDVAGVAVTSMRLATVALDAGGEPLLAVPNRDGRASGEALELAATHGAVLYERTGRWPAPVHVLPRLLWIRRRMPDATPSISAVLSLDEWIAMRLCGERAADPSQAAESLIFDIRQRTWLEDLARDVGLRLEALPPLLAAGKPLGRVLPEAARHLGLLPGTPVAMGGADTQCSLIGSGIASPGRAGVVLGTTVPVQVVSEEPRLDPLRRLWTGCHVVPGLWTVESNGNGAGEALEWLAEAFYPGERSAVARLLAEAALAQPGASGIFSTLGVQVMDARRMELPVGSLVLSHMVGAEGSHQRTLVARAAVEGVACGVLENLRQVEEVTGPVAEPIGAGGGLVKSAFLTALLADVLGHPLQVAASPDSSALGAALCAATGSGVFPDLTRAAAHAAAATTRLEPDILRHEHYQGLHRHWRRIHDATRKATTAASEAILPAILAAGRRDSSGARPSFQPSIVVTADLSPEAIAELRDLGDVRYASFRQSMRVLSGARLVGELNGAHVFVTEVDLIDAAALEELPNLRVVVSCRGKAVNVDVEACTAFGIPVLHAPGRNAEAVADLTVAFFLMLARKLPEATRFLREENGLAGDMARMGQAFRRLRGHELGGCTIGLIGFGAVARGVTRRLLAFGCQVLAYDPFVSPVEVAAAGAEPVALDELLERSDFVSLHAAVPEESSSPLLGPAELARIKRGAFLVNTARAALVDQDALIAALREGRLAGAAVDVFSVEPPGSDHPLLALDNVIATPHVGGNTFEVSQHQGLIIAADLRRLLSGERPHHVLNPEALEGFSWTAPKRNPPADTLVRLRNRKRPSVSDLEPTGAPPRPAPSARSAALPAATIRHLEALLRRFAAELNSSARLREAASAHDVSIRFDLVDAGLSLALRLSSGQVDATVPARDKADVNLRMTAAVFDGVFTGANSAMEAVMDGRLAFTGDVTRAMALQELNAALTAAYRAARAETGAPTLASDAPPPSAGMTMATDDVRGEIVRVVEELYAQGLITATGGNVSTRVQGCDDQIWITPSRMFKGALRADMLVRIDLDGRILEPAGLAPSSERLMHCAVYRARPEARAVIHAHAPHATILANSGLPFLPISTEAAFFGDIPRIPFIMPGSEELAEAVAAAVRSSWAVFLQNHGLLVAGRSLRRAADMIEVVERSCQIILGCHALGREPPVLPPQVLEQLRRVGDMLA